MPDRVDVYKDTKGEWRWSRFASNGEQLSASSEGYDNKQHAVEQAYQLNHDVVNVRVVEGDA